MADVWDPSDTPSGGPVDARPGAGPDPGPAADAWAVTGRSGGPGTRAEPGVGPQAAPVADRSDGRRPGSAVIMWPSAEPGAAADPWADGGTGTVAGRGPASAADAWFAPAGDLGSGAESRPGSEPGPGAAPDAWPAPGGGVSGEAWPGADDCSGPGFGPSGEAWAAARSGSGADARHGEAGGHAAGERPVLPRRRAQQHLAPQLREAPAPRRPADTEQPVHDPGLMAAFQRGFGLAQSENQV